MAFVRPLRIIIAGGTGQLGQLLARHFHRQGNQVTVLALRPKPSDWRTVIWNGYDFGDWARVLESSDVVINLAGRSVNCRYTSENRREILTSRTITTGLLGQAIAQAAQPPALWLNASTATIYRHSFDRPMDEVTGELGGSEPDVPARWAFSIEVARAWERALFAEKLPKTRRVAMRAGMVMSPEAGGAFDLLLRLVRWGFGGRTGSGRQYISWIHDIDFVRAVEFLMARDELADVVNICSPYPTTNRKFMSCLRRAWCTSYIGLPAPSWILPLGTALLRTEAELVLKSRRVVPQRLLEAGFDFHFPNWRGACQDLVTRWRQIHGD